MLKKVAIKKSRNYANNRYLINERKTLLLKVLNPKRRLNYANNRLKEHKLAMLVISLLFVNVKKLNSMN